MAHIEWVLVINVLIKKNSLVRDYAGRLQPVNYALVCFLPHKLYLLSQYDICDQPSPGSDCTKAQPATRLGIRFLSRKLYLRSQDGISDQPNTRYN